MIAPERGRFTPRIEALKQFSRDTLLLVLDQARWSANPLGMLWPEPGAAFVVAGGGGPPVTARRPAVIIVAG